MKVRLVDGNEYEVAHQFNASRALINYDGAYVFVDNIGDQWDFSGEPAREDEKPILDALLSPTNNQTVVTTSKG